VLISREFKSAFQSTQMCSISKSFRMKSPLGQSEMKTSPVSQFQQEAKDEVHELLQSPRFFWKEDVKYRLIIPPEQTRQQVLTERKSSMSLIQF
jgi:hypothetical protein